MTKMKVEYLGRLHTKCKHESGAEIETDAPKDNGGKGELFSPTDLMAASLGSCMLTLMALAAVKLGVDLTDASAEVEKQMAPGSPRRLGKITVRIRSSLSFDAQVREKLEKAAIDCPVHHSLHPSIKLEIGFTWGI